MRFAKYHGIGNDFVMIADPEDSITLGPDDVRALCDRRFGIGADGVIRVAPATAGGDLFMDYVNSDGSVGEMCGNGIRCLAVFARAEGMTGESQLKVETRAGLKVVEVLGDGRVRVDMGPPIFDPVQIPVAASTTPALHERVYVADHAYDVACVSMGNPHAVISVEDPYAVDLPTIGPAIEDHEHFPNKTNVEFMRVDDPHHVTMRVWERGSGETLACGTGACAVAVIARVLHGAADRQTVALPGGELEIEWDGTIEVARPVYLTGPAVAAFSGEVDVAALVRGARN